MLERLRTALIWDRLDEEGCGWGVAVHAGGWVYR